MEFLITGCFAPQVQPLPFLLIIAVPRFGWQHWRNFPMPTFSRTTRSESVKTARLMNRSRRSATCAGVGDGGPTHDAVETISSVRVMPNIDVIRPADPEETAGAFVAAMERTDGPTLIALTRQVVPILNDVDLRARREGVRRGGYISKRGSEPLGMVILS